jgi:hypothetical protein
MQTVCTGQNRKVLSFWALKETSIEQERAYCETIASGWCSMACWEMEVAPFYRLPSVKIIRLKDHYEIIKYKYKRQPPCRVKKEYIIAADCHLSTQGNHPSYTRESAGPEFLVGDCQIPNFRGTTS